MGNRYSALCLGLILPAAVAASTPRAAADPKVIPITVTLSSHGNDIAFDQKALQVKFGRKVRLTYKNAAKKNSGISHNVYVLAPGAEEKFIQYMAEAGYEQSKLRTFPGVVASSKNIAPGEEDSVEFTPDKPGFYSYVCTMPGHGDKLNMRGVISVNK